MPPKKRTGFPLNDDTNDTFEESDFILNYKPSLNYVEPEQEPWEPPLTTEPEDETIDSLRDRTAKLIAGLDSVVKLADLAQKRIDNRVASAGGVTIKLDPIRDSFVIAAMKRQFPEKEDPSEITHDEYKVALDRINQSSSSATQQQITAQDLKDAQADPTRTDFGGLDNQAGENRTEISSPFDSVRPVDLDDFQKKAVLSLFKLMLPLIKKTDSAAIKQHKLDTPHK